jgi:DNA-binding Xre family transcriptional regulator
MLQISFRPLMAQRGIKERLAFLQKQGLSFYAARHLAGGHMRYFNLGTIEKICVALECTPNDIIFYSP